MAKFYLVGGYVRDMLLGVKSKDMDYAVEAESFEAMREAILARGGEIFLESPEHFTIRAKVEGLGAADFVLTRKDGKYSDGRHPETVEIGTLHDDLARRDFTMNAIAQAEDGTIIDPFDGRKAIEHKIIRTVGDPYLRFSEDKLRILRAIRFAITKGFALDPHIVEYIKSFPSLSGVSLERIREELFKMFEADTMQTLTWLNEFHGLRREIFSPTFRGSRIWLKPTIKGDKEASRA